MYFHGGQWSAEPHRSVVNISTPTPDAVQRAETLRTDLQRAVPRSGFGTTGSNRSIYS